MGLSREEQQALDEIEECLAFDDPDLDAILAGPPGGNGAGPPHQACRPTMPKGAWVLLVGLAYLLFLIGVVMLLKTGESPCPGTEGAPCEQRSPTST
ncbi:DUF3040 domain-containing protein [Nonomuraea sp. SYSU D8015]|uniref:DUF3040 domain-containing protein n=1 Tax=Nonomuraea sp. SYSU D8015 TaxID=2593644 RepID=UPI00166110EE|nr:DUF3040 domain-containing protein [Nonomuraea sp. SYSU D8015]